MPNGNLDIDQNFKVWMKHPEVIAERENGSRYAVLHRGNLVEVKTEQLYVGADGQREALSREMDAGKVRFIKEVNGKEESFDLFSR